LTARKIETGHTGLRIAKLYKARFNSFMHSGAFYRIDALPNTIVDSNLALTSMFANVELLFAHL